MAVAVGDGEAVAVALGVAVGVAVSPGVAVAVGVAVSPGPAVAAGVAALGALAPSGVAGSGGAATTSAGFAARQLLASERSRTRLPGSKQTITVQRPGSRRGTVTELE